VSSYKRPETLLKTIDSVYNQCDIINISLNDYDEIPEELYDDKINIILTNNEKGDAYKFYNLINSDGYFLTIDDDLIYGENYTKHIVNKIEQYKRKNIITVHGRNFDRFPIKSYYNDPNKEILHFKYKLKQDSVVQFGGTGVMGFHTDLFKIELDYFKHPNMADIWIGKYAKENGIKIVCVKHNEKLVKQQFFENSIYNSGSLNDTIQTTIVNQTYTKKEVSVIIPTYNNIEYIKECLDSVVKSCKNIQHEILVGIDNCEKTLEFVKNNSFNQNIRFFYFNKNVGPYIVKNTLSKISNGDIIMFFDSDDIMDESMIKEIVSLQQNCDFVKPKYINFKNNQNPFNMKETETTKYGEGVFSIKRDLFLSMNGFEGWRCAADSDFMGRLYRNQKVFKYTTNLTFYRRVHSESLTQQSETNMVSKIRREYANKIKAKTDFGPLPFLHTENYNEIISNYFDNDTDETDKYNVIDKINLIKEKLKFNVNKTSTKIDYDRINRLNDNPKTYNPKNNIKPIRENTPVNRNELFELKKGTLAEQNKRFFPMKRKLDL
jgi:glycosyltransferase involved in cell wall biosynthesis